MISEAEVIPVLETIVDPEFRVDVYNLGLIYKIDIKDNNCVEIDLSFTSHTCPAAVQIIHEVKDKLEHFFPNGVKVNIVQEPRWNATMIKPKGRKKLPAQIISFLDFDIE